MVLIIQYAPRQLTLSWQMEAVLSGVKINGSNTRLLYWCHGVDGRFVSSVRPFATLAEGSSNQTGFFEKQKSLKVQIVIK